MKFSIKIPTYELKFLQALLLQKTDTMSKIKIDKILKGIKMLNFNTLYINIRYLPLMQAIQLPIVVSRRTYLLNVSGKISIKPPLRAGMIRIGYGEVGIFDKKHSRTVLDLNGQIIFNGKASIGHGSKISVSTNGVLKIGNNFIISAETAIVCHHKITIGNDCLFSWDNLIMDTDLHKIIDHQGNYINQPKPITIGNKVWIGCRCLILKGAKIPNGNIIAANSTISKPQSASNSIIGKTPARKIKDKVEWKR